MSAPATLPDHVRERVDREVAETLADAGCSGWVHATTIGSPQIEYSFDADAPVVLASVWTDRAASPEMCAFVRDTMRRQVFTARLASGFPFRRVTVAGKTGTLVAIRNEIGVVEFPGELPVAVAVFTLSARSEQSLPQVDRAIGEAARTVVTQLRVPAE